MASKNNNHPGIRLRDDGRWEYRVQVPDPKTGKKKTVSRYATSCEEAKRKRTDWLYEINHGVYTSTTPITVEEWFRQWLHEYTGNLAASTYDSYVKKTERFIIPALGHIKLQKLTTQDVQGLLNDMQRNQMNWLEGKTPDHSYSAKYIHNVHGIIHVSLKKAVGIGLISKNVADECTLPKKLAPEIESLTEEQVLAFLDAVAGHEYELLYKIALFTGMRQGEILGLSWGDIDFRNGSVTVRRQLQRNDHVYDRILPKYGSVRKMYPAPIVMNLLRQQKEKQALYKKRAKEAWNNPMNLAFTKPNGENVSQSTVYKQFKKLVEAIGCPNARFHDLRHTFTDMSFAAGDDPRTVQGNLGHKTATFTLERYAHFNADSGRRSAQRMQHYIENLGVADEEAVEDTTSMPLKDE